MGIVNHFTGTTNETMIGMIMGGPLAPHNAHRCDTAARRTRVYLTAVDICTPRRPSIQPYGHRVCMSGINDQTTDEGVGWQRQSFSTMVGYRLDELKSFTWRKEETMYSSTEEKETLLVEIKAHRVEDSDQWSLEYTSTLSADVETYVSVSNANLRDATSPRLEFMESRGALEMWFRMLNEDGPTIIEMNAINDALQSAAEASQFAISAYYMARHPEPYMAIRGFAAEHQIATIRRPSMYLGNEVHRPGAAKWFQMLMALPQEEEMPTFREGFDTLTEWYLTHIPIMWEMRKEHILKSIRHGSNSTGHDRLVAEIVRIAKALKEYLGEIPAKITFTDYAWGLLKRKETAVLAAASEQLGYELS